MFNNEDVKLVFDILDLDTYKDDKKYVYIRRKIFKHGYLRISLNELNYINSLANNNIKYNIIHLKNYLNKAGIGYTKIIKNIGIPRATLSKVLNNERNIKLEQLNDFFVKINKSFKASISKEILKEGE